MTDTHKGNGHTQLDCAVHTFVNNHIFCNSKAWQNIQFYNNSARP